MIYALDVGNLILGSIIALIIGAAVLSIMFKVWYYTYHGDLPRKFIGFIIFILIIIAILAATYFIMK